MCQASKTGSGHQRLDGSLVAPFREQLLQRVQETFERTLPLVHSPIGPISDIMLKSLRNGCLLTHTSSCLNLLDVLLEFRGLDAVKLDCVVDDAAAEILIFGEEVVDAAEFLGILDVFLENLK